MKIHTQPSADQNHKDHNVLEPAYYRFGLVLCNELVPLGLVTLNNKSKFLNDWACKHGKDVIKVQVFIACKIIS